MTGLSVELVDLTKVYEGEQGREPAVTAVRGVSLGIHSSEFFTLLGPSGCGKTTILRMIGGFVVPTGGEIFIEGQPMSQVPPYRRPVNIVFQDYALFPHLTVGQNVGFGLSVKRVPRAERNRRVREMLALVQLSDLGDRKPAHLSGGQQQRVALARALINEPAVLLLDEPLGALDLKLRKEMQLELKHLQQQVGITFIYVTHDQEEALTMSDRIAVMSEGKVLQVGDPVTVYEKPATRFVADFIGESNFLQGKVVSLGAGQVQVSLEGDRIYAEAGEKSLSPGQSILLTVRPEKLNLLRREEANGAGLDGQIQEVVYIGTDTRFVVNLPSGKQVVARLQNVGGRGLGEFRVGDAVKVTWAANDARVLTN